VHLPVINSQNKAFITLAEGSLGKPFKERDVIRIYLPVCFSPPCRDIINERNLARTDGSLNPNLFNPLISFGPI
jgi:hypothetical protein